MSPYLSVLDVLVRLLQSVAALENNIMFVAWSSKFATSARFEIAKYVVEAVSKIPSHAFVTTDMSGYSLIFDVDAASKVALFKQNGEIGVGDKTTGHWLKIDSELGPPKDLPRRRASAMLSSALKHCLKRPVILLFFKGDEEQGEVSKYVLEQMSQMSRTARCLCIVVSVSDNGSVLFTMNGVLAPVPPSVLQTASAPATSE